jgi:lysophospholipase L1-like esterase
LTRLGRRLLLLGLQLLLVLLLLEGSLRLLRPLHGGISELLYLAGDVPDFDRVGSTAELLRNSALSYVPHRQRGGFVLNAHGLRTPEYDAGPLAPGVVRIVALGDSFTYGDGVPQDRTWPARLARVLAPSVPGKVEVISLGVPGVGPRFERRMFALEGAVLQPRVVVLGLFVGNDLTDEQDTTLAGYRPAWTVRHSLVARLGRNLWRLFGANRRGDLLKPEVPGDPVFPTGGYSPKGAPGNTLRFTPEAADAVEAERLRMVDPRHAAELAQLADDVAATVGGLAADVRAAGAELVVLIIPDQFQVVPGALRRAALLLGQPISAFDVDAPQRLLAERLAAVGIPVVDVLPACRASVSSSNRLYLARNIHWNAAGHEIGAQALAARIAPLLAGTAAPAADAGR